MDNASRKIAKNTSVMMASQMITWGLALVVTVLLPRYLGAAGIGKYQLASSLWVIVSIFISFGMDTLLTKEISRYPKRTSALISTSLLLRVGIFLVSFVLMVIYTWAMKYPQETTDVIFLIGISSLVWQIAGAFRATLQGLERMEFMSLSDIAAKAILTAGAILLLLKGYGLLPIAALEIVAALVGLTVQYVALRRIHPLNIHMHPRLPGLMLKSSFPFLMLTGLMIIYGQIDIVVISLLVVEKQVGWYSAAIRLTGTFVFIPTVLMAALLPASSRMFKSAPDDLRSLMRKSFDLLLLVSIPIGIGVMAISKPLISLLYGPDFVNSVPILAVMGIVLIFVSINMLIGQFFISSDRQYVWVIVMAAATILTIPLDLVLVPWSQKTFGIGALGGSLSYLLTEVSIMIFGLAMLPKGMLDWGNAWRALRVAAAGLGMAAVVWPLRDLFIAIPIGVGIASYLVFVIVLRVITQDEWNLIRGVGINALNRMRGIREQAESAIGPVDPV